MDKEKDGQKRRSIIELSCDEARAFLLKQESYFTIELPPYFQFNDLFSEITRIPGIARKLRENNYRCCSPRSYDDVNHLILNNKDGRYAWRPLELIHPALYVSLVHTMTECDHWKIILDRFCHHSDDTKIKVLSLPVESLTAKKDKAEQVSQWWTAIEQESIALSLNYEFAAHTDIVDCYAAIYTHSIAWALHTKKKAKAERRDKKLIGNIIDNHIRDMRQGQTKGIPQGSVLMDFIAEMVLAYADAELTDKLNKDSRIKDYRILRYRDDYRIFVHNPQEGELILQCLTEVMHDLGLKLNPGKTCISHEVIRSSIKDDKLGWLFRRQGDRTLQKHLLIIHDHSNKYPNTGSVEVAMNNYYERLLQTKKHDHCLLPLPLIGVVVDIAYRSPRTYAISAAIVSKLISSLDTASAKRDIVEKIVRKFNQVPNTGCMDIWLQRISLKFGSDIEFKEPLCQVVRKKDVQIWNNEWISWGDLLTAIDPGKIVNAEILASIKPIVSPKEVALFPSAYY